MVEEASPEFLVPERIAQGVDHLPLVRGFGGKLPDLLHPDGIDLRGFAPVQPEAFHRLSGQRAADPFPQNHHLGQDVDTGFTGGLGTVRPVDSLVSGADSNQPLSLEQQLRPGETGKEIHPPVFRQLTQPFDESTEGNQGVSVVVEWGRHQREPEPVPCSQVVDGIPADRRAQRRISFQIVRDQLGERNGVQDGPRQGVGSNLPALLDDGDAGRLQPLAGRGLPVVGLDQILEVEGSTETGGAGPDEENVDLQPLASFTHGGSPRPWWHRNH